MIYHRTGTIIYNKPLLPRSNVFRMRLEIRPRLSGVIPGQFLHLKLSSGVVPLLRRPFSIYQVFPKNSCAEILYQVVGVGTRLMTQMKSGMKIDILGPLGNGFSINKKASISLVVAGGIGTAGLHLLLVNLIKAGLAQKGHQVYILVGARTKKELYLVDSFRHPKANLKVATEDGSAGQRGLVTDLLEQVLTQLDPRADLQIYTCGPEGMVATVAQIAGKQGIPCQVSLERSMGCGIGICRACVCKLRIDKSFRWATTCKEGPVFEASQLIL